MRSLPTVKKLAINDNEMYKQTHLILRHTYANPEITYNPRPV